MKVYKLFIIFGLVGINILATAQSNTAITSGNIGQCRVWDYPYTLYNNNTASKTINDGVTVNVNEDKNSGPIILSGSAALTFSGSNGISLDTSSTDTNCKWDIGTGNNSPFTGWYIPYVGNYKWSRGSGWNVVFDNSRKQRATVDLAFSLSSTTYRIFTRDEDTSNACHYFPNSGTPATWTDTVSFSTGASDVGQQLTYSFSVHTTTYQIDIGCQSVATLTRGNSQIIYDN
jgi:hypothetical protein